MHENRACWCAHLTYAGLTPLGNAPHEEHNPPVSDGGGYATHGGHPWHFAFLFAFILEFLAACTVWMVGTIGTSQDWIHFLDPMF